MWQDQQRWKDRQSHRLYLGHLRIKEEDRSSFGGNHERDLTVIREKMWEKFTAMGNVGGEFSFGNSPGGRRPISRAGEFTRRAFLNERLDLAQSEAIIDIIRSQSGSDWN